MRGGANSSCRMGGGERSDLDESAVVCRKELGEVLLQLPQHAAVIFGKLYGRLNPLSRPLHESLVPFNLYRFQAVDQVVDDL